MKTCNTVNQYLQQSLRDNWEELALTDFQGVSFQYRDVARKVAKLHLLFEHAGLKRGDKIALCGRNSAQWSVAMIASLTYGTIAVPILHDFKPDNIHHLVTHSDSRLLFVDSTTWENLDPEQMPILEGVVLINDYSLLLSRSKELTKAREHLNELFGRKYPERFTPADVVYTDPESDTETAIINYTSGSTGFSKGVMIPYRALWSNMQYTVDHLDFMLPGDPLVCMLPLAHMYGLMVEMLHPFIKGCHVYFLTRTPSPRIIMEAFATVKPKLIVTVPLIIEKIIKTRVFPLLDKPLMKLLLHVPFVDDRLLGKIKTKLTETFGGNLRELIIGGAGLNNEVETFLRRIKFPYTVGYGMTECAPLIAYAQWDVQRQSSCGRLVDRMEMRVDSSDPTTIPGVLHVRGHNVMNGYYKNDEATSACIDSEGWMSTGDIVQVDSDGYIYIRGRDKNMILGPSGQNIYPEEIEQKLNNLPYVAESVVVDRDNKLVALIHPDMELAAKEGFTSEQIRDLMNENIKTLNAELPSYSQVASLDIYAEEFEKTPKRSIKRYLYK